MSSPKGLSTSATLTPSTGMERPEAQASTALEALDSVNSSSIPLRVNNGSIGSEDGLLLLRNLVPAAFVNAAASTPDAMVLGAACSTGNTHQFDVSLGEVRSMMCWGKEGGQGVKRPRPNHAKALGLTRTARLVAPAAQVHALPGLQPVQAVVDDARVGHPNQHAAARDAGVRLPPLRDYSQQAPLGTHIWRQSGRTQCSTGSGALTAAAVSLPLRLPGCLGTQFVLLELEDGGPYAVLLPLIDGDFRATLRASR